MSKSLRSVRPRLDERIGIEGRSWSTRETTDERLECVEGSKFKEDGQ